MDPLYPEPRDPDFAHERSSYFGADDKCFAEDQQRLSGHNWENALKLRARSTTTADGDDYDDDEAECDDED